jgi:hypothetical protein
MANFHEVADLMAENSRLRAALGPFAEIGRLLGWVDMSDDDPHLGDHIMDAPIPEIHPDAAFCLMIGHFREAAITMQHISNIPKDRP